MSIGTTGARRPVRTRKPQPTRTRGERELARSSARDRDGDARARSPTPSSVDARIPRHRAVRFDDRQKKQKELHVRVVSTADAIQMPSRRLRIEPERSSRAKMRLAVSSVMPTMRARSFRRRGIPTKRPVPTGAPYRDARSERTPSKRSSAVPRARASIDRVRARTRSSRARSTSSWRDGSIDRNTTTEDARSVVAEHEDGARSTTHDGARMRSSTTDPRSTRTAPFASQTTGMVDPSRKSTCPEGTRSTGSSASEFTVLRYPCFPDGRSRS